MKPLLQIIEGCKTEDELTVDAMRQALRAPQDSLTAKSDADRSTTGPLPGSPHSLARAFFYWRQLSPAVKLSCVIGAGLWIGAIALALAQYGEIR